MNSSEAKISERVCGVRGEALLVAKARELAGLFSAEAEHNDRGGRLADKTVSALKSGGYFGLLVPKCFGGAEVATTEALEIYEIISAADSSTGWVLMASNVGTGSAAGYLPPAGAQKIFGKSIPVIAGEGAPRGRADIAVEGGVRGYRLSGRWSYGSGVLHADYLHTGGIVYENGAPRIQPGTGGPEARTFIVPIEHAEFLGNWDSLGLRGTASVDYEMKDVFVPEDLTHLPHTRVPQQGGSFFKLGIVGMSPLGHTGVALGIGRRVLDELRALAHAPSRPTALSALGGGESFQERYAAAEGKMRAGRAFCFETWNDVQETLDRGDPLEQRQYTLMRLSLNHVTTAVAEICSFAHKAGGGVALRSGAMQRCFRDMFTATQHRIVSDFMLRECGRELLGSAGGLEWTSRGLVPSHLS